MIIAAAVGFLFCGAVVGVVTFFTTDRLGDPAVLQPVAFNHLVHVEEQGLDCVDCHLGAESEIHSGLPDVETCAMCHEEPQGEGAEEARLVQLLAAGEPLAWGRIFRQPPHVFFSHRRHTSVAELDCTVCHDSIGSSTQPPPTRRPLRMKVCVACHEEGGASTNCTACHR